MFLKKILTKKKELLLTRDNLDLLGVLIRTNMKLSNHNSFLGIMWSFIGPASLLAVMYFVFNARFGAGIAAYPLYLLIGIVCISFFATATSYLAGIFITQKVFILNTVVPRENVFIAGLFTHILKFTIEIFICVAIGLLWHTVNFRFLWLLLPLYVSFLLFVAGVGLFLTLVCVFSRDVQHIWVLVSRLLFFASPIFFRLDSIAPPMRKIIYFFNPLTPFLISFRQVLMHPAVDGSIYFHSLALGPCIFLISYIVFIFFEHSAMEKA
ncbi:MAG: ABC transporter permease [Candidatus Omnitrophota bacterium]|nr:ABC transporter permease [Candidatus Omnitrophota bacterium]